MKKQLIKTLLLVLVFFSVIIVQAQSDAGTANKDDIVNPHMEAERLSAEIDFVSAIPLIDAIKLAREQDLEITQIKHSFDIGNQTFVGFLPVLSKYEDIPTKLTDSFRSFLADLVKSPEELYRSKNFDHSLLPSLKEMDSSLNRQKAINSIQIIGLTVEGNQEIIKSLPNSFPLINQVKTIDSKFVEEFTTFSNEENSLSSALAAALSVDWEKWLPEYGSVKIGPSTLTGKRTLDLRLMWDDKSGFGWNSTYEHDFFLNNSSNSMLGPGTYLNRAETWGSRIPRLDYAVTNLPTPYLDTRFGDPSNEVSYTMGSAKASDISANTWYYIYIRTVNGDASRDNAKLSGQLGHRIPFYDYSTWGSFGQQSESIISGTWPISVPSSFSWRK